VNQAKWSALLCLPPLGAFVILEISWSKIAGSAVFLYRIQYCPETTRLQICVSVKLCIIQAKPLHCLHHHLLNCWTLKPGEQGEKVHLQRAFKDNLLAFNCKSQKHEPLHFRTEKYQMRCHIHARAGCGMPLRKSPCPLWSLHPFPTRICQSGEAKLDK